MFGKPNALISGSNVDLSNTKRELVLLWCTDCNEDKSMFEASNIFYNTWINWVNYAGK